MKIYGLWTTRTNLFKWETQSGECSWGGNFWTMNDTDNGETMDLMNSGLHGLIQYGTPTA